MAEELETKQVDNGKDTADSELLAEIWREEIDIMKGHSYVITRYYKDLHNNDIPEPLAQQLVVNLSNYLLELSFKD